jgi:hypothetical protein
MEDRSMPCRLVYVACYRTDSPDGVAAQVRDGRDLEADWNRLTTELRDFWRRPIQAGTVGVLALALRSKLGTARKVPGGQEALFIAAGYDDRSRLPSRTTRPPSNTSRPPA